MSECRTVFVGAVEEGRRCLEAMVAWGEPFAGIVTVTESLAQQTSGAVPFDDLAARLGVPLLKVRNLNAQEGVEAVRRLRPDLILVIGWTRLLGPELLAIPRLGAIGFHASLLPRYRGRAPVNWAIINGEAETGNTMFFLDDGVDTGDIIAQRRIAIDSQDTCATLYAKVADSAIEMLRENLPLLKQGTAPRRRQEHHLATVMPKRTPEDGRIDWSRPASALHDWVRALTHPYPGAFTHLDGRRLFLWEAMAAGSAAMASGRGEAPGVILGPAEGGVRVQTGAGALTILRFQWADGDEQHGSALAPFAGCRFDDPGDSPTTAAPGHGPGRTAARS